MPNVSCLGPPLLILVKIIERGGGGCEKVTSNINLCGDLGCFLIFAPCCTEEDEFPKGYGNYSHHNAVLVVLFHRKSVCGYGVCIGDGMGRRQGS